MNKIIHVMILVLILSMISIVNAQTFEWAQKFGTNTIPESVSSMTTDNLGNYYVTGLVSGTFNYAASNNHIAYFGDTNVSINGANDIFIAKYSSSGSLVWVRLFGGDYDWNYSNQNSVIKNEVVYNLIYNEEQDALYFSGMTVGNASFDGHLLSNQSGVKTSFVAKLNLSGNCLWAKPISTNNADCRINISNLKNSILVSGIIYYPGLIGNIPIPSGGFIARLNVNGVFDYANTITSGYVKQTAVNGNDIYVFGEYAGVDTLRLDTIHYSFPNHRSGFFVFKLDSTFHVSWSKYGYSDSYITSINAMYVDKHGKSFFKLGTANTTIIDSDTLIYNPNQHLYLIGIDSLGNTQLITKLKTGFVYDISKDSNDNFNFIGAITGVDSLCSDTIHEAISQRDLLICNLTSDLECNNYLTWANGVAFKAIFNNDNSIVLLGIIGKPNTDCGNCSSTLNLGNISLTSAGSTDGFIAKFNGFTSGIDDRSRKSKNINESLLIYANPSNGKCDIDIPDEFLHEKELKLSIYSSTGVLIQQAIVNMNEETIKVDIQQEAKGMYNATLSNGKKVYQGRIVFE